MQTRSSVRQLSTPDPSPAIRVTRASTTRCRQSIGNNEDNKRVMLNKKNEVKMQSGISEVENDSKPCLAPVIKFDVDLCNFDDSSKSCMKTPIIQINVGKDMILSSRLSNQKDKINDKGKNSVSGNSYSRLKSSKKLKFNKKTPEKNESLDNFVPRVTSTVIKSHGPSEDGLKNVTIGRDTFSAEIQDIVGLAITNSKKENWISNNQMAKRTEQTNMDSSSCKENSLQNSNSTEISYFFEGVLVNGGYRATDFKMKPIVKLTPLSENVISKYIGSSSASKTEAVHFEEKLVKATNAACMNLQMIYETLKSTDWKHIKKKKLLRELEYVNDLISKNQKCFNLNVNDNVCNSENTNPCDSDKRDLGDMDMGKTEEKNTDNSRITKDSDSTTDITLEGVVALSSKAEDLPDSKDDVCSLASDDYCSSVATEIFDYRSFLANKILDLGADIDDLEITEDKQDIDFKTNEVLDMSNISNCSMVQPEDDKLTKEKYNDQLCLNNKNDECESDNRHKEDKEVQEVIEKFLETEKSHGSVNNSELVSYLCKGVDNEEKNFLTLNSHDMKASEAMENAGNHLEYVKKPITNGEINNSQPKESVEIINYSPPNISSSHAYLNTSAFTDIIEDGKAYKLAQGAESNHLMTNVCGNVQDERKPGDSVSVDERIDEDQLEADIRSENYLLNPLSPSLGSNQSYKMGQKWKRRKSIKNDKEEKGNGRKKLKRCRLSQDDFKDSIITNETLKVLYVDTSDFINASNLSVEKDQLSTASGDSDIGKLYETRFHSGMIGVSKYKKTKKNKLKNSGVKCTRESEDLGLDLYLIQRKLIKKELKLREKKENVKQKKPKSVKKTSEKRARRKKSESSEKVNVAKSRRKRNEENTADASVKPEFKEKMSIKSEEVKSPIKIESSSKSSQVHEECVEPDTIKEIPVNNVEPMIQDEDEEEEETEPCKEVLKETETSEYDHLNERDEANTTILDHEKSKSPIMVVQQETKEVEEIIVNNSPRNTESLEDTPPKEDEIMVEQNVLESRNELDTSRNDKENDMCEMKDIKEDVVSSIPKLPDGLLSLIPEKKTEVKLNQGNLKIDKKKSKNILKKKHELKKTLGQQDYIPLDVSGPTKFGVVDLEKFRNFPNRHEAFNFKRKEMYGSRVKRVPYSVVKAYKMKIDARKMRFGDE